MKKKPFTFKTDFILSERQVKILEEFMPEIIKQHKQYLADQIRENYCIRYEHSGHTDGSSCEYDKAAQFIITGKYTK